MANNIVTFDYVNHRGEKSNRTVLPSDIRYCQTPWHPENQWMLHAYDMDKMEYRTFAMKDITAWTPKT